MLTEPTGLDPVNDSAAGTTGGTHMAAIYDALIRWNPENGEFEPQLAEGLSANDDSSVWTLTLRKGVNFSDGSPLLADAVVKSFNRYAGSNFGGFLYKQVSQVEAVDDLTVKYTLTEPWAGFPMLLAGNMGYVTNPAAVDAMGKDFSLNPKGAGAGPYIIDRFEPGSGVYLKANPNYWGGPVCVESLTFVRIPGGPATYEAYKTGQLQMAFLREPIAISAARDDNQSMFKWAKNAGTVVMLNNGVGGSKPPTADVRVRKAIDLALDPAVINDRVNEGKGVPSKALFPESSRFYTAVDPNPVDPDAAKKLVDEVIAEGSWDGSIEFACHNAPSRLAVATAVEAMLQRAGFKVTVKNNMNVQELLRLTDIEKNYMTACSGFQIGEEDVWSSMASGFSCSSPNRLGYCNQEMDAALAELKQAKGLEAQKAVLAKIQKIWNETVPSSITETIEEVIVTDSKVQGVVPTIDSRVLFHNASISG